MCRTISCKGFTFWIFVTNKLLHITLLKGSTSKVGMVSSSFDTNNKQKRIRKNVCTENTWKTILTCVVVMTENILYSGALALLTVDNFTVSERIWLSGILHLRHVWSTLCERMPVEDNNISRVAYTIVSFNVALPRNTVDRDIFTVKKFSPVARVAKIKHAKIFQWWMQCMDSPLRINSAQRCESLWGRWPTTVRPFLTATA